MQKNKLKLLVLSLKTYISLFCFKIIKKRNISWSFLTKRSTYVRLVSSTVDQIWVASTCTAGIKAYSTVLCSKGIYCFGGI
jgi:hypothetical protein